MNKKAFTLAEVLITLTIIGVIAALTIPILMKKYEQKDLETHFKTAYTTLSQAIQLAEYENGLKSLDTDDDRNLMFKYLKIRKNSLYKSGHSSPIGSWTKSFDGTTRVHYLPQIVQGKILENNIYVLCHSGYIFVDTNGFAKPNREGYDFFLFSINRNNGRLIGYPGYITEKALNDVAWNNNQKKGYWKSLP